MIDPLLFISVNELSFIGSLAFRNSRSRLRRDLNA
jgi:hypothetical protein